jgi:hypothetical protein
MEPEAIPWDAQELSDECACTFSPLPDGEESVWYLRRCAGCGSTWNAHHCPHDGWQDACPECGRRARQWGCEDEGSYRRAVARQQALLDLIGRVLG